jgi:TP901 family phage tail tape measure protein
MATENVTTKFRVDISDLKKNIAEADKQVKQYRAELQNASAGMKKGEETADSLSRKIEAQSKIVEVEKAKLEAMKQELIRYEDKLKDGESIVSDLTERHRRAAEQFGETSTEAKELARQLDKAREAQERNITATENLRTRIIQQDTAVKNAQGLVNQYTDALNNLQHEETETGNAAEKTTNGGLKAFTVALGNLASQAITSAVNGLGNLVKSVIETGKAFDTAMSKVKAISGRVADEDIPAIVDMAKEMGLSFEEGADATSTAMNIISAKAEQLGATTKFTATEAADAFSYMAMAGWKAEDMLKGIDGVMSLAEASGSELALTSDIVTDSLSAFGEKAEEAGRLSDIMAAAATNSNTNVEMMGETFKFAAPLAAALGYNMEDVAVATGIMANSGIKATMAGTSLRAIFTRLSTGTGEAGAALKGLGIDLEDGEGNMKSWLTVMDELRGSFGHLRIPINELNAELNKLDSALEDGEMSEEDFNEAQEKLIRKAYGAEGAMKAQYASMLAGKNGLSGFLAIVNSSEDDFDKLTASIYNSDGAAAEMASVMRDNLQGSLTLLSSAFDGFKKSIYEGFSAPMNDLVKSVTNNIMPALQGVVDGVPGSSDKLTDAISNFINNSLKDAAKILPEAVNVIGTVAGSIGEAAVRNMPEFIRNGVSLIEQIVDGIVKASPDIVKGIGKFIAEATKGAGDLLVHLADTVVDTLPDFIDAIFAVSPKIIDSIIRVTQKIAEALPEILEKIIDAIPDAIDGIMEFIGTQTPKLVEAVIQIVTGLVEALPSIVQHLVDAVPPIIATLTKMLPELFKDLTIAIVENAPALVRALIQLTVEVTKMLPDIIMPIIRMMPELTVAMAQAVVESAPEVVKAFGEMFTDVANSLPALFGAVVTAFVGFRDDIAKYLSSAWTEAETAASGAWDNIKQGASDAVDNVGKFFSGMWDNIKKTVSEAGSKIGETLGDTIKEGVNGVLEFVENGINNIPDAINGAIDLINNLPGVEISPIDRIKLPRLAKGAVVDKPTIAQIGEAGKEAIIPLERNKQGLREIAQAIRSEIDSMRQMQPITNTIDRGTTINLTQNNTSPKALSTYEIWRQSRNMLRLVKAQGGV